MSNEMREKIKAARYRVCTWGNPFSDTPEMTYKYGIEARIGPRQWAHLARDVEPIFYNTFEEAAAEVNRLNKLLPTLPLPPQ